jgi:hypothetical protein
MLHLSGFREGDSALHLAKKRPIELHLVFGNVNNDDAKSQFLEVLLEFKSLVNRDQNIEPVMEKRYKFVILEPIPAMVDRRSDLVAGECLGNTRIDAGV